MSYTEKEKLIKADITSIENRVRHAFNQGYDLGFKDGKERTKPLKQEPTTKNDLADDCISKKYALMCVDNHWWNGRDIRIAIEKAPPVYPKSDKPSGKWILLDECSNSGYYCSNCQKKLVKEGWSDTVKKIKFCPNCGAKMDKGANNE